MRLTKAQAFALIDLDEHRLNDGWRRAPAGSKATLKTLRRLGLVEAEHNGIHYAAHRITDAGRAALASERKP